MVELHKAGAKIGHIHLDRALTGARLAGQTARHRLHHLVGEVILAALFGPAVAHLVHQLFEAHAAGVKCHLFRQRVEALLRQLTQPLAHQAGPPLG